MKRIGYFSLFSKFFLSFSAGRDYFHVGSFFSKVVLMLALADHILCLLINIFVSRFGTNLEHVVSSTMLTYPNIEKLWKFLASILQ